MPYKIAPSKLKALKAREVAAKHAQLRELEQEHSRLMQEHEMLAHCCELLAWMRLQHTLPGGGGAACGAGPGGGCGLPLEEELLLQELEQLPCSSSCFGCCVSRSSSASSTTSIAEAAAAAAAATAAARQAAAPGPGGGGVTSTLSPPNDPLFILRSLLGAPGCAACAAGATLGQLQQEYSATVCELSVNMALLEEPQLQPPAGCGLEPPAAAVQRLVLHHVRQLTALLVQQRQDLLMGFFLSNCLSGAVGEERQRETIRRSVAEVRLSAEQQRQISRRAALFKRLLAPVVQARQQLQRLGFAGGPGTGPARAAPPAAALAAAPAAASLPQRAQSRDEQRQRATSLTTLMRKEIFLKSFLHMSTLGSLTWLQVARLMINSFPYPVSMLAVAEEVASMWDRCQQQQQQQAPAAAEGGAPQQ